MVLADGGIADSALGADPGVAGVMSAAAEQVCDVLVVGSGAGGLATAVVAAFHGLEVLVVEKEPVLGGTTAWSGGWLWIPRNPLAVRGGHRRGRGRAAALSARASSATRRATRGSTSSWRNGPEMVRFFEAETAVAFVDGNKVPDFHATPGHATGGRSVAAAPYDGRALGPWIAKLRPPLDIVSVAGMGIASGADLNHFVNATRVARLGAACGGAVPAARARPRCCTAAGCSSSTATRWWRGCSGARSTAGVAIRTEAPAEALVVEDGRVVGARIGGGGAGPGAGAAGRGAGDRRLPARRGADRGDVRASRRHHSAAPDGNTGDGLRMGEAVGGERSRTTWCIRGPGRRCRWCRGRTAASGGSRT